VRSGAICEMADLARRIHRDDVSACRAMGKHGAAAASRRGRVLTHCNAGALATGGYGTALGVIRAAIAGGRIRVFADETRPYLQGARLTAWELHRDGIPVTVIADTWRPLLATGRGERWSSSAPTASPNGDVANKIGTYAIACLAQMHDIPFYVAAPWSTVDLATPSGAEIVIEERKPKELTHLAGQALVPDGVRVYNPAFDVTPARLITAIITERGCFDPAALSASS
jgi:methylthioribose-1-phosphate isomerase